jgi:uncharacterized protein YbgA (DUF1722 family)/uncharacterized protein YbbK (DUF523 family)
LTTFPKPRVVISKCIGFEPCRYNGQIVRDDFVPRLEPHVEFVCVCPEVEIGLGTPRSPVRVVSSAGNFKLIQPESGLDLTEKMRSFSSSFLSDLKEIDGFILKNRSPSCGIGDVKFYSGPEKGSALGRTSGFFGAAVLEKFGDTAIEDEGRLNHLGIREHFLTRIFAFARCRNLQLSASIHGLVRFHAANKLLLMAYNQTKLRELGRIVANNDRKPAAVVLQAYRNHFREAFRKSPRHASPVNVLTHALGYFKKELSLREKRHFLSVLDAYRLGTAPLSSAVSIIRSWIVRFEIDYLQEQTFFDPFPEELMAADHAGRKMTIEAREKSV